MEVPPGGVLHDVVVLGQVDDLCPGLCCLDDLHWVRRELQGILACHPVVEVQDLHPVLRLEPRLWPGVREEQDMERREELLRGHVLGGADAAILQHLSEAVDVVRVVHLSPCNVKANDGLAVVHVRHVAQFAPQGDGLVS